METMPYSPPSSREQRQLRSYVYLLNKIEREGISLSTIPDIDFYIDRAVRMSRGPGWDAYAAVLKELIRREDIDGLRDVLLSPSCDRYRSISPLIMLLMTPEEGQQFRQRMPVVTPDMLKII